MSDEMIFASPECAEIFDALCKFQAKCEAPKRAKEVEVQGKTREGTPFKYKFKYAPLEEIHRVIKEPMATNGLGHRQFLAAREGGWVMRTIITHKSGQWMGCDYPVIAEKQGGQGFASGTTFARRYGLTLALGIAAEDDDDGNLAEGNVTQSQAPRAGMVRAADVPPQKALRDQVFADAAANTTPQKANGNGAVLPVSAEEPPEMRLKRAAVQLAKSIAAAPTDHVCDIVMDDAKDDLAAIEKVQAHIFKFADGVLTGSEAASRLRAKYNQRIAELRSGK